MLVFINDYCIISLEGIISNKVINNAGKRHPNRHLPISSIPGEPGAVGFYQK
ncbi:hypothetical protein [Syntrophus aciditrophicus]|uniref:hypothetical protein n=1 Tax=Syntrophus aciditrophicus TaxID=316277 RepID=UPI001305316B|nr:hypothetical protein [Syntrophus aciditrophicus]